MVRPRRKKSSVLPLALAALLAWAVAAYFAITGERGLKLGRLLGIYGPSTAAAPPSSAPASSPSSAPSSAPTGTAAASARAPVEVSACVRELFAQGTFGKEPPAVEFLCTERDLRVAGKLIRKELVRAGRDKVTQGMREWAGLGWFEMAAVTLLRGRCCASPSAARWKLKPACPIDKAIVRFEQAVAAGDRADAKQGIDDFSAQAHCLYQLGQALNYGQEQPPGGERNALMLFFERVPWKDGD